MPTAVCTFAIWSLICSKLDVVFARVVLTIDSIDEDTVEVAAPSPPLALSNDVLSVDYSTRITEYTPCVSDPVFIAHRTIVI